MLKNYLKTALRHFKKNPAYSFINIAGLAVGMACCLLISLFVLHEISYDNFHQKTDRIFRVTCSLDLSSILYEEAAVPFPAAEAFKSDFPEVEEAVRFYQNAEFPLLQVDDRKFTEEHFFFADANIFKVFDFPLVQGDPKTALLLPNNIVLSRAAAQKYFGSDDPIGKVIKYENEFDFLVTAVRKNGSGPPPIPTCNWRMQKRLKPSPLNCQLLLLSITLIGSNLVLLCNYNPSKIFIWLIIRERIGLQLLAKKINWC